MKYLNDEEVKLLNEMKDRCLNGGQYKDENAKKKFDMLCHLEDFAVQYYNLQEVIKEAREKLEEADYETYSRSDYIKLIWFVKNEILSKGENK